MKDIKVTVHHSYGRKIIRPACINSELFTYLSNNKTLTSDDIGLIKRLGYTVTVTNMDELAI